MKRRFTTLLAALLLPLCIAAQEHRRLTNLPHVYIDTFTGYDVTSKTVQIGARMWYVDEQDHVTLYDSITIRGRGNSTWNLAKKPYRIKLPKKARLLGSTHANAKKWTLLANHGDKSLIRNALASYIGELCGQPFTPAAQFVDLTLNGNYRGCYQLSDQVDVRKGRVNVVEQDYPLEPESNITGGYLVEADGFMDYTAGVNGWRTPIGVPMTIHYPDDEEIDASQLSYISTFVNRFESRLFSNGFADPEQGYRAYVDSASLASWYVASEITANPDYVWSMYYYKDCNNDRLYFGPLWDYDIAFNNDNRLSNTTTALMADVAFTNNGMDRWIGRFWSDEWFQRLVFRSYSRLYADGLEQRLLSRIDSLATLLQESQQLNYEKWSISTRTLREVVLYSTYDEYVADLRRFVSGRLPSLLRTFASRQPDAVDVDDYEQVVPGFTAHPAYYYRLSNAGTGTVLDLDADERLVANAYDEGSYSQQWRIITLRNGYQMLVNRLSGHALADPTTGQSTPTTNLGTQLAALPLDSADKSHQWNLVGQTEVYYNLNNRRSQHTANLSGGNAADGTSVLSYTNDDRNASSRNRLWLIEPADKIPTNGDGIESLPAVSTDYALAYNPQRLLLHFGADDPSRLSFTATVFDQRGRPVLRFHAGESASVAHLPKGLYIVAWDFHGHHAVKFLR